MHFLSRRPISRKGVVNLTVNRRQPALRTAWRHAVRGTPATSRQVRKALSRAWRCSAAERRGRRSWKLGVDPAVAGEEALGLTGWLDALHLPLPASCRLVRRLGSVVEVAALSVLDAGQDLP